MTTKSFHKAIADEMEQRGYPRELSAFVCCAVEIQSRARVAEYIRNLKSTIAGTAILRAVEPPGQHAEPLRVAARRLCCHHKTLAEMEARFRKLMSAPPAVVKRSK